MFGIIGCSNPDSPDPVKETAAVTIKAIAVKDGKMLPKELDLCIAEMHGVQQVHQITTQTLLQKIWRNKQTY